MSLTALKAKTLHRQNISSGGFSLNGGNRNTNYVGKTMNHSTCAYNDSNVIKNSTSSSHIILKSKQNIVFNTVAKTVAGNATCSDHLNELSEEAKQCRILDQCD
jgi:hypothetical protein